MMYMWVAISTLCVTLLILQRFIRIRGKGNAALQGKAGTSNESLEVPAPSPGATEIRPHQYDVFLNHRGPDVKKTFVAHLNAALKRNGFRPFLDAKSIGQGRHVFSSIDKALKGSCVHVAVFSKRYAESKYCLNELCDMLRSGQVILPVYYGIEPEALRRIENGPFKKGFEKHKKRGRIEEVWKWKEALRKVADLRGFRLDEVNGDEEQLIRSILVEVRSAIPPTLLAGKQLYGMNGRMKDVLKMLDGANVLSLVGTGGIGKTTLAMEIYNHFVSHRQFEKHCFLKDVRLSTGPCQLQQDLLYAMGHGDFDVKSPSEYKRIFDVLVSKKMLIIIDDIDDRSQFEALIPNIGKLESGSRVVITSRQRDVVMQATVGAKHHKVYEVPLLNDYDSRYLFNHNAFLSDTPDEGFVNLATKVADACHGHALSLEVIGASLFDKKDPEDKEIWLQAERALQRNGDIFSKLRSTYDSLPSNDERAMFQDIACMLIGMEKDLAMTIWESCSICSCSTSKTPAIALRRLVDRSLVKVDEEGNLRMHDVLRAMGRDIVEKEARRLEERTHLWSAINAMKVLNYNQTNTSIRGICLAPSEDISNDGNAKWPSMKGGGKLCEVSKLASIKELHLLILDGCEFCKQEDFSNWPQELRWLQWRSFCYVEIPSQLKLPSLVVLDLSYSWSLTRLWGIDAHIKLPLLQTLILTGSKLRKLPKNIDKSLPKLKRLLLNDCQDLQRLPNSIGHLTKLKHLDLSGCENLVTLPDGMVRLLSLNTLLLGSCMELQQLPKKLGNMTNLETLDVSHCRSLFELPASIGGLKMLRMLNLSSTKVEHLSVDFGQLASLTLLSISSWSCHGLRTLPDTFGGLQALSILHLENISADLGCLGTLTSLREFQLYNHSTITILPKSFGNLKCMLSLEIIGCYKLLTIEALPKGLEHLKLQCHNLTRIPSFVRTRFLLCLDLRDCKSLEHIHGLESLIMLEHVNIWGCFQIGQRICLMGNKALQTCHLSGSNIGVAYNSRWLDREPAIEVVTCLGTTIPLLTNGIGDEIMVHREEWTLVVEASIFGESECVAFIGSLVVNLNLMERWFSSVHMRIKIEVVRYERLVVESFLSLELPSNGLDNNSQHICWCTLRRNHEVMHALQHADQIRIFVSRTKHGGFFTVMEGSICIVHHENEHFIFTKNSEVLSKYQSEELARQFHQLVLKDSDYN